MEAVIKSAASAASSKTKSRGRRPREVPRLAAVHLPSRRPGASLDLGPLDLVFLEAALAADLITASISLHVPAPGNPLSGPCSIKIMYPCEWRIAIPTSLMRVDFIVTWQGDRHSRRIRAAVLQFPDLRILNCQGGSKKGALMSGMSPEAHTGGSLCDEQLLYMS